jgi:hypothetical protein
MMVSLGPFYLFIMALTFEEIPVCLAKKFVPAGQMNKMIADHSNETEKERGSKSMPVDATADFQDSMLTSGSKWNNSEVVTWSGLAAGNFGTVATGDDDAPAFMETQSQVEDQKNSMYNLTDISQGLLKKTSGASEEDKPGWLCFCDSWEKCTPTGGPHPGAQITYWGDGRETLDYNGMVKPMVFKWKGIVHPWCFARCHNQNPGHPYSIDGLKFSPWQQPTHGPQPPKGSSWNCGNKRVFAFWDGWIPEIWKHADKHQRFVGIPSPCQTKKQRVSKRQNNVQGSYPVYYYEEKFHCKRTWCDRYFNGKCTITCIDLRSDACQRVLSTYMGSKDTAEDTWISYLPQRRFDFWNPHL